MVELRGFEPLTPCVQSRCSPTELQPHNVSVGCVLGPVKAVSRK